MVAVRKLGPDDWELFRDIRLRALADAPDAFCSTLADEQAFTEEDWRRRLHGPIVVIEDPEPVSVGGTFDRDGVPHVWGCGHIRLIAGAGTRIGCSVHCWCPTRAWCSR
jgi:hypothetical protein